MASKKVKRGRLWHAELTVNSAHQWVELLPPGTDPHSPYTERVQVEVHEIVTPAKKPAKCDCNRVGLTTSDCGMFMDRCTNPKCKRAVKPAKKGRKRG